MHPRCFNCHGGVSPALGTNHSGGIQTNDCYGCHNDAVDDNGRPLGAKGTWHLPPPEQFFVGKDAKMMCALMADFVMHMGKPHFIDHLMRDTLVVLGFIGQRGGAIGRRDPPPMTQAVFVDSAKVWLNEGMAACERVGTIIEKEKVLSDTTYPGPAPNSVNRVLRSGTRTATITLVNGRFHGTFIVAGQNVLQTIAHRTGRNGACTITSTNHGHVRWQQFRGSPRSALASAA